MRRFYDKQKTNRSLSSMLGAALIVGLIQMPAFAVDNVQAQSSYAVNSGLIGNNNSVEQNGVKITLNSVVGTKMTSKLQSQSKPQRLLIKMTEKKQMFY